MLGGEARIIDRRPSIKPRPVPVVSGVFIGLSIKVNVVAAPTSSFYIVYFPDTLQFISYPLDVDV